MRVGPTLALLGIVLFAGCALPSGGGPGTASTVTPATVPDDPTPFNLGPPVEAGDALAPALEAHQQALNGTGFTYRATYRGPVPNEPQRHRNVSLEGYVGANRSVYYLRGDYGNGVYRQWSNGTLYVSLRTGDASRRRGGTGDPALPGDSLAARLASGFLFPFEETTVTRVVRDGDAYRIDARVDESARVSRFKESRVPNATIRMTVGRDRVIRSYRLEYVVVHDGTRFEGVNRYAFEGDPSATLPRPEWVDNVLANESG